MKTSLCANVQLNRSNFDFNLKQFDRDGYALSPSYIDLAKPKSGAAKE